MALTYPPGSATPARAVLTTWGRRSYGRPAVTHTLTESLRSRGVVNPRARQVHPPPWLVMATLSEALEGAYEAYKYDCSGFVRETADQLADPAVKVPPGNADAQMDYFEKYWVKIDTALHAAVLATEGRFVVAGVRSDWYKVKRKNGHVVVIQPVATAGPVTAKDLWRGKYPRAWGGDIGRSYMSKGTRSVGEIFAVEVRDKVRYFAAPRGAVDAR